MLRIYCPYCREAREEEEFHCKGEAHIRRPTEPDETSDATWGSYLYFRKNPRGRHLEIWVHAAGCRKYFNVVRDTVTYEIECSYPMGQAAPPIPVATLVPVVSPTQGDAP
jgi:sarcosine oxidase subunit delta